MLNVTTVEICQIKFYFLCMFEILYFDDFQIKSCLFSLRLVLLYTSPLYLQCVT